MSNDPDGPIHLEEDGATGDRFLVYASVKGLLLDIKFEGDTLWMTQAQISDLFGKDVATVSRHISNILEEGELDASTSLRKTQRSTGRPATLYNLDVVISVGYRVSSSVQATVFRRWATSILMQYALKGFVVDSVRLKSPDNTDRVAELRDIIRDIRSDEANVYREIKRICSMCQDYDKSTEVAQEFFRNTQAKLIYAVVSQTPSEVIYTRSDRNAPNMGLQNWPNESVRESDVATSKNYLMEREIRELNRLTTILLDIFEDQLDLGRLVVTEDARRLLDQQIQSLGRALLHGGGRISSLAARQRAKNEYDAWKLQQKEERHRAADLAMREVTSALKDLPKR